MMTFRLFLWYRYPSLDWVEFISPKLVSPTIVSPTDVLPTIISPTWSFHRQDHFTDKSFHRQLFHRQYYVLSKWLTYRVNFARSTTACMKKKRSWMRKSYTNSILTMIMKIKKLWNIFEELLIIFHFR